LDEQKKKKIQISIADDTTGSHDNGLVNVRHILRVQHTYNIVLGK